MRLAGALATVWLLAGAPVEAEAVGYLDELVARARAAGFAARREWLDLGHYRPDLLGAGHTSLIDSPGFFLAGGQGKVDPAAELEATLVGFFEDPPAADGAQHPQCAFPARHAWLKAELGFDAARLPEQPCPRFEAWRAEIGASQVTLVFPAAYLNNPSSMFGHTFLRLDRPTQDEATRLLSYAVNYGALTGDDNGVMFALHGLTGGYPGTYSVLPYHQLVRQYTDLENRDIWEYQLNFSPAEVDRLVAHLWELREQYAYYYFFDENCSYQLLFLLDVARPGMRLTDRFPAYVLPVDTVRAVVREDGLLDATMFRPSSRTRIEHALRALAPAERRLVDRLAEGELGAGDPALGHLAPARRAAVLETAAAFVTYRMRVGQREREVAARHAWGLLAARSRLGIDAATPPVVAPAVRPDQGHASARLTIGFGARDGRWFQELGARGGYHTLRDPLEGYIPGAGIEFLDLGLRRYQGDRSVVLDRLGLVGIRSLAPRNELVKPISWRLGGGLERYRTERSDEKGTLVGMLRAGAGPSLALGERGVASVMAEASAAAGTDCPDACFLAAGPALTVAWPATDRWQLAFEARYQLLLSDGIADRYDLSLNQTFVLGPDLALKLDLLVEDDRRGAQTEWASSLHWYF